MKISVNPIVKYAARSLIALISFLVVGFAAFLAYATITDYVPAATEAVPIPKTSLASSISPGKLTLYTWNIGYCGLGENMDFFYEGGKMVRPTKAYYTQCRDGVINQLQAFGQPDFILLQEVDQHSARTYRDNQPEKIEAALKNYTGLFALNYNVPFVPVPVTSPMGKVKSGILTLSKYQPVEVTRYQFPSAYSWPKKLFMLDRCFMLSRFNMRNGKQLVLINTHNSAYADAVALRAKELNLLKNVLQREYAKGNYVIAGGDWNQNPVPYSTDSIEAGSLAYAITPGIPADFLPAGFTWAFDARHTSNRNVDAPYLKGKTPTTLIDFFVLSPNIALLGTHVIQAGFQFADHQPVQLEVELK